MTLRDSRFQFVYIKFIWMEPFLFFLEFSLCLYLSFAICFFTLGGTAKLRWTKTCWFSPNCSSKGERPYLLLQVLLLLHLFAFLSPPPFLSLTLSLVWLQMNLCSRHSVSVVVQASQKNGEGLTAKGKRNTNWWGICEGSQIFYSIMLWQRTVWRFGCWVFQGGGQIVTFGSIWQ